LIVEQIKGMCLGQGKKRAKEKPGSVFTDPGLFLLFPFYSGRRGNDEKRKK
jgi:hypothetical protein